MDSLDPLVLYVIAHDNLHHLRNFVKWARHVTPHIVIIDNASTYPPLLEWYLTDRRARACTQVRLAANLGPQFYLDADMRERMPERFMLSDPDLEPVCKDPRTLSRLPRLLLETSRWLKAWKVAHCTCRWHKK